MLAIWKYKIPIEAAFEIEMPEGAEILSVQTQKLTPVMWVLVSEDPLTPKQIRRFRLYGTGHPVSGWKDLRYLGTFQTVGGNFIGHVFETAG